MSSLVHKTLRRVVWRRILDERSFEECVVSEHGDGFGICGRIIAAEGDQPLTATYDIRCDRSWSAQAIAIEQTLGGLSRRLRLERADKGWLVNGALDAKLDGCAEPDLGLTPSTNALAIWRLQLGVGQSAEITCAWVKFPTLSVQP